MNLPFQLQATEEVVMLLRRHWFHLYPKLMLMVLVAVAPPVVLWFVVYAIGSPGSILRSLMVFASVLWIGFWLFRTYLTWYRYQHDIWVLTNQRLVDSLQRHWFHHRMSSADLIDIEDVSVKRHGVLQTLFDYGDVQVQTAAVQHNFIVGSVPRPGDVLTTVDATRDEARREFRAGF